MAAAIAGRPAPEDETAGDAGRSLNLHAGYELADGLEIDRRGAVPVSRMKLWGPWPLSTPRSTIWLWRKSNGIPGISPGNTLWGQTSCASKVGTILDDELSRKAQQIC